MTRRLLFVLHWLVVGGEETEVRLLAQHLRPDWEVSVVVCHHEPWMPDQSYRQLVELGVPVDTTPYRLSDDETVDHLTRVLPEADVVVACQGVPHVHEALRRLAVRPPLVEHGGLVREATANRKDVTDRYVGVCAAIRDAAAAVMPDRPEHALEIPSMVDLDEFDPADRPAVRQELALPEDTAVIGFVGRLDHKKRVEDVLDAAALLAGRRPDVRWVLVGGPNFHYPEYAETLRARAGALGLGERVCFLGDRPDVPRLMAGFDALVWLSDGEGMPHVLVEAGAARLPVVVTRDNGSGQQVDHGVSGLFVPKRNPAAVADTLERLVADPALRHRLGAGLRVTVEQRYSADVVVPQWRALLAELADKAGRRHPAASVG